MAHFRRSVCSLLPETRSFGLLEFLFDIADCRFKLGIDSLQQQSTVKYDLNVRHHAVTLEHRCGGMLSSKKATSSLAS